MREALTVRAQWKPQVLSVLTLPLVSLTLRSRWEERSLLRRRHFLFPLCSCRLLDYVVACLAITFRA